MTSIRLTLLFTRTNSQEVQPQPLPQVVPKPDDSRCALQWLVSMHNSTLLGVFLHHRGGLHRHGYWNRYCKAMMKPTPRSDRCRLQLRDSQSGNQEAVMSRQGGGRSGNQTWWWVTNRWLYEAGGRRLLQLLQKKNKGYKNTLASPHTHSVCTNWKSDLWYVNEGAKYIYLKVLWDIEINIWCPFCKIPSIEENEKKKSERVACDQVKNCQTSLSMIMIKLTLAAHVGLSSSAIVYVYFYTSQVKEIRQLCVKPMNVFLRGYAATYWLEVCLTSAVNAVLDGLAFHLKEETKMCFLKQPCECVTLNNLT